LLVVVGSRHDQSARKLVASWLSHDAALLTCEDLSKPGWQLRLPDRTGSRAVVDGRVVHDGDIRGVLMRRPWIMEQELAQISAADREYVAAEMNAFLLAWLAGLPCTVLNRPNGMSLCGPSWRPLQWTHAASSVGIPIKKSRWQIPAPVRRKSESRKASPPIEVTVVGERCFGAPDDAYVAAAKRLAVHANVGLLGVRFDSSEHQPCFLAATAMPGLEDAEIARAVCEYLLCGPAGV
jgi:hypothetical protein